MSPQCSLNKEESRKPVISPAAVCQGLLRYGVFACSAFAAVALSIISIVCTAVFPVVGDERLSFFSLWGDGTKIVLGGILFAVAILALLFFVWKHSPSWNQCVFLVAALLVSGAVGLIWVVQQQAFTSAFPDSYRLIQFAREASTGDWSSFTDSSSITSIADIPDDAHLYFSQYPFQSGVFLFFYGIFVLFGDMGVVALQIVNVISNLVILGCLYDASRLVSDDVRVRSMTLVMAALFLPLTLSASLPYGNSLGFALGSVYLVVNLRALRSSSPRTKMLFIAASLPILCAAVIIKSTISLFAIAVVLAWAHHALSSRTLISTGALLASVLVLFCSSFSCDIPVALLEQKVGYSFGDGMPKTSWFAIGLSESSNLEDQAGWWDPEAIVIHSEANGDVDEQSEAARSTISESLMKFVLDPAYAISFFTRKVASEWAEPTFGSLYYSALSQRADGSLFNPAEVLGDKGLSLLVIFLDGIQIVIFLAAAMRMVCLLLNRGCELGSPEFFLVTLFFVGAGCYLLWEAKSVYLLPFFLWLIPFACNGIRVMILGCRAENAPR